MAKKKSNKKIRTEFRKRHDARARKKDFTREFSDDAASVEDVSQAERVSGKGKLTRKRTVVGEDVGESAGFQVELEVSAERCRPGRVMQVFGLASIVRTEDGNEYRCTVRGVLKSLATDLQHVVVAGDFVTIQIGGVGSDEEQATIVRVEPRRNQICRTSRQRQQIIASNIDLALIVASAGEPILKPNLVDRFLVSSEQAKITPVVVINKVDLVDPADLQPVVGVWSQLGYPVVLTSAVTGLGIDRLLSLVAGRDSVVTGQSGVGKSSILNAIEPGSAVTCGRCQPRKSKRQTHDDIGSADSAYSPVDT